MRDKKNWRELVVYLIFGVLTTLVSVVSFFVFDRILGWQYLWANALSIGLSIIFAYVVNKLFVFESKTSTWQATVREFLSFIAFRLVSGVFDMLSMWLLVDVLSMDSMLAKIITQFIVVVLNYLFSKFFVFGQDQ